jgi:HSP20 family protein
MPCDPLRDLRAWQERLERLAAQGGSAWDPPIDVYETPSRYVITAEVPGLTREQIELAVQDSRVTIRGVRPGAGPPASGPPASGPTASGHETPARRYHQVERGHGSFQRTFEFVDAVDQDGITADLRQGVLTVTLPKLASAPRRIEVQ